MLEDVSVCESGAEVHPGDDGPCAEASEEGAFGVAGHAMALSRGWSDPMRDRTVGLPESLRGCEAVEVGADLVHAGVTLDAAG